MSTVLLRAQNVTRRVADGAASVVILDEVSLEVAAGERVALVGPSGSGKSTLLHILGALDPDYQGSVEIDGVRLEGLADHALAAFRNRTLGFVFQSYNLLGHLTALDNVLLPSRFANETPDAARARGLLASVGLGDKAHRKPQTLSGGERQRVAIARALYHRPKLVLCDEPTGNLDRETGKELLALFARLTDEGVALLIASHDQAIAAAAHRMIQLRGGRLQ